jgi:hypothetical protein
MDSPRVIGTKPGRLSGSFPANYEGKRILDCRDLEAGSKIPMLVRTIPQARCATAGMAFDSRVTTGTDLAPATCNAVPEADMSLARTALVAAGTGDDPDGAARVQIMADEPGARGAAHPDLAR